MAGGELVGGWVWFGFSYWFSHILLRGHTKILFCFLNLQTGLVIFKKNSRNLRGNSFDG